MLTGMTPVATLPLMLTLVLVFLRGVTGSGCRSQLRRILRFSFGPGSGPGVQNL